MQMFVRLFENFHDISEIALAIRHMKSICLQVVLISASHISSLTSIAPADEDSVSSHWVIRRGIGSDNRSFN